MDIIPAISSKILTKDTTFANYLLIIDAYPKLLTLFGMENVTNKDVMDKLDMFQERFEKVDEFVWWYLEWIQTDSGTNFTSKDFQDVLYVFLLRLTWEAPDHQ